MHELSIAHNIMRIVLAEVNKFQAYRVVKVSLKIGELTGVFPDSLSFCFELISRKTVLEGAILEIERVPIKGYCALCDREFSIEYHHYHCPYCGDSTVEIISGHELQIDHIEVEDETDSGKEGYPCCP